MLVIAPLLLAMTSHFSIAHVGLVNASGLEPLYPVPVVLKGSKNKLVTLFLVSFYYINVKCSHIHVHTFVQKKYCYIYLRENNNVKI